MLQLVQQGNIILIPILPPTNGYAANALAGNFIDFLRQGSKGTEIHVMRDILDLGIQPMEVDLSKIKPFVRTSLKASRE